ncbi:MAG: amidohydrolase family protein [Armatimonadetes bacterium]|nr:amidohydrolase family protein [Armatimonadota bacterium]
MQAADVPKKRLVVDFHVHAFPDHVAPSALDSLFTAYGIRPVTDGTISGLLGLMEREGVSYAVVMPVATKPAQVKSINNWAASHTDPRIICFGGIHPDLDDPAEEIDRIVSLGLPGIKIQANWQDTYVDDPKMYPIYEAALGRLIIMFHAGDEPTEFEKQRATPERLARVHADFPGLTMVAAHMGGYRMWDDVEKHLIGKNIYMDTSACFPEDLPNERLVDMIRRHGVEKILFATDIPLAGPKSEIAKFEQLGLTDDELEMIFWKNAKGLLGDRVKGAD